MVKRCETTVNESIKRAKLEIKDIDKVIMIGGTSQIRQITDFISNKFGNDKIVSAEVVDGQLAVATGACVEAFRLVTKSLSHEINDLYDINEIAPMPLGLKVMRDGIESISTLINGSESIPHSSTKQYNNSVDNQEACSFSIYQGDEDIPLPENLITTFYITNIPKLPREQVEFTLNFHYDENGLIETSVNLTKPLNVKLDGEAKCSFYLNREKALNGTSTSSCKCVIEN